MLRSSDQLELAAGFNAAGYFATILIGLFTVPLFAVLNIGVNRVVDCVVVAVYTPGSTPMIAPGVAEAKADCNCAELVTTTVGVNPA